MSVLHEYLASQGYVVIVSSLRQPNAVTQTQVDIHQRIADTEYLMEFAATLPNADINRIALLGINSESLPVLLFQMKNMRADVVVNLDGWDGANEGLINLLTRSLYFDPVRMRVPYLRIQSDWSYIGGTPGNLPIFDTLLMYSNRHQYMLKEINHGGLISSNLFLINNLPPEKRTALQFLYTSIGNFFDAYLKKSETALAFIKKSAVENGFPEGMMKAETKKTALPSIPTTDELAKLFADEQYEKITKILKEAKRLNPNLPPLGARLNNQGYSLLRRKKYAEAITVFKLNTELYPEDAGWLDSLAEGYEASGDKESMKKVSQQVLDLLDKREKLSDEEKALKGTAEKRLKT